MDCLEEMKNKVNLHADLKFYFDFDQPLKSQEQPNTFQLQTHKEWSVSELADLLAEFADVHLVKQASKIFWIQMDEFSQKHTI